MTKTTNNYRLSILGAGGFTHFSVEAFLREPKVNIIGVFDKSTKNAQSFAEKFGCRIFESQEDLLADAQTDIVYIATPPFLHFAQSKAALLAGKYVICEKPAALKAEEVEELIEIASKQDLLYVVNLMQRYNPLFEKVGWIIREKILGEFLHGYFENYASSENLDENHWMWDESKSGGIFIEHAVHFFDLFAGWLGQGETLAAQKVMKKGTIKNIWPEVQAICSYNRRLVNFYHGFHQADRMDRQEMKLVFETGDLTLSEWVPSTLSVHALISKSNLEKLQAAFPGAETTIAKKFEGDTKQYRSNFCERSADFKIIIKTGNSSEKYNIYQRLLQDMISDQLAWIHKRDHPRVITGENALHSTRMAETATKLAIKL